MSNDWIENARLLTESARAIVPADGALARVRDCRFSDPGFSPEVAANIVEMGWLHLRLDEADGGLGLGMRENCALLTTLGEGIIPEPIVSSALAFRLLGQHLPEAVQTGEKLIVTAWQDKANDLGWHAGVTVENGRATGRKMFVEGAAGADYFAVLTATGVGLIARDADGASLSLTPMQDGTQVGTLDLNNAPIALHPCDQAQACLDEAILAQAAFLFGASERAFETTLEYLRVREQFGRPIGSFQAIQHRATSMKMQIELARASIGAAAAHIDAEVSPGVRGMAVSRAKARVSDLSMLVAREAVQMHGAIGITDEADIGLFVRKSMSITNYFGSAPLHRARYAALSAAARKEQQAQ